MKGEITELSRYFDEIEMKRKYMIVVMSDEKPDLKLGKCTIQGDEK